MRCLIHQEEQPCSQCAEQSLEKGEKEEVKVCPTCQNNRMIVDPTKNGRLIPCPTCTLELL